MTSACTGFTKPRAEALTPGLDILLQSIVFGLVGVNIDNFFEFSLSLIMQQTLEVTHTNCLSHEVSINFCC